MQQSQCCRKNGVDFTIVKSDDFRNNTDQFAHALMDRIGLSYSPKLLSWHPANQIPLDNLNSAHSHLYKKVLSSSHILPATEPIPSIHEFPIEGGIRSHVVNAMNIFEEISSMKELLTV